MRVLSQNKAPSQIGWHFRLSRELVLLFILVFTSLLFGLLTDRFWSPINFEITSRYVVEVGLISIAMTMIIIIRGIDISVGSILALSSVIFGFSWQRYHLPLGWAAALGVVVGTMCGLFNGLIIAKIKVPDLVVTLATMAIFRGIADGLAGGQRVYLAEQRFVQILGAGTLLGIPVSLFILVPAIIIGGLVLSRSAFGRQLYTIGNNEIAARFAGLKVDRIRALAYTLSGFLSGLSAIIYCSRVGTARSNAGLGLEFDVITGVVLGGTSMAGGAGSIWGSILGLILVVVLRNGLNLLGVASPTQAVVIGVILVATVLVNENLRRRRA